MSGRWDSEAPEISPVEPTLDYGDEISYATRTNEDASRTYSARTSYVGAGEAVSLLGYDPDRSIVRVRNLSLFPLIVGPFSSVSQGSGYVIPAGQADEFTVQDEIYGRFAADGEDVLPTAYQPVALWIESNR